MHTLQLAIAICLSFITFGYATSTDTDDKSIVMSMVTNATESSWKSMEPQYSEPNKSELFVLCEELQHLEEIVLIVNNASKLAEVEKEKHLTPQQVASLKEEAANATVKLNQLKSNTTLVAECLIVEAHLKLLHQCKEIVVLVIIIDIASNTTLLQEIEKESHHDLTVSQNAILKDLAANATTELVIFEKNTTLILDCKTLLGINLKLNTTTTTTTTAKTTATTTTKTTAITTAKTTTVTTAVTTAKTTAVTTTVTTAKTTATTTTSMMSITRPSTVTINVKTTTAAMNTTMTKLMTTSTSVTKLNVSTTTTNATRVSSTTTASVAKVTTNMARGFNTFASSAFAALLATLVAALML